MNTTRDHIRGFRSPHALSRAGAVRIPKDSPVRGLSDEEPCLATGGLAPFGEWSVRPYPGHPSSPDRPPEVLDEVSSFATTTPRPCFTAHPAKDTPRLQVECLPPSPPGMTSSLEGHVIPGSSSARVFPPPLPTRLLY
jgi:hypothetical protein